MRVDRAAINLPLGFLQGGLPQQFLPGLLAGSTRAQRKRTNIDTGRVLTTRRPSCGRAEGRTRRRSPLPGPP